MKVLITGGNGFIGRALVQHLVAHGHQVTYVARRRSVEKLPAAFFLIEKIDKYTDWGNAFVGIEVVIHLAARAHVMMEKAHDPSKAFHEVNVAGTLNMAQQAIASKVNRIVFLSSIGVLGSRSFEPFKETDSPAPTEPYSFSKWEAEKGLTELVRLSSTELVIIRPPLVYGPNAPGNFGRLMRAVKNGIPLPFGAVNNSRSLVGLGNLVDLIRCCCSHPKAAGELFLAGDGENLSTTQLLRKLGVVLHRPARLLPVPVWVMESIAGVLGRRALIHKMCFDLQIDITKARELLEWVPPFSIDEGFQELAETAK